jgi:tyrosyl-tRNA synthetase
MFTLLGRDEIDALTAAMVAAPHERAAQRRLAADVTARVHGEAAAVLAEQVSRVIFDKRVDARELSGEVFDTLASELPHVVARSTDGTVKIVEALEQAFALSRTAARKLIQQGAVHVNGDKLAADTQTVDAIDAVHGRWFLLRKGGRDIAVVELA